MSEHLTDELLSRLIDGDLSLAVREAALGHLRECARCSARQEALVAVAATLRQVPPVEVSAATIRAIRASLEEPAKPRRWPTAAMAVAAIGTCVAALLTMIGLPLAAAAIVAALLDRVVAVQLPSSAGHLLGVAFVIAVAAPLAAYPLARWR